MTHDQEEERSILIGTIQKNLWMRQKEKDSINNRGCTGQSEPNAETLQSGPVSTLSSLLGPDSQDGSEVLSPHPMPSLFPSGWRHS